MKTSRFTGIKNIILLINILFTTMFTSPTTILKSHNLGDVFNINELETIGYIQIDEITRNELMNSFNYNPIQSGKDIFRNFFDILVFLIIDEMNGNNHNIFRANPALSKSLLQESQALNILFNTTFHEILTKDSGIIAINQFLAEIMLVLSNEASKYLSSNLRQDGSLYNAILCEMLRIHALIKQH